MTSKAEFDAYVAGSLSSLDRVIGATISAATVSCIIKDLAAKASEVIDAAQVDPEAEASVEAPTPAVVDVPVSISEPDVADPNQDKRDRVNSLIAQLQGMGVASYPKTSGGLVPADQLDAVIQQCEDLVAANAPAPLVEPTAVPTAEPTDATAI